MPLQVVVFEERGGIKKIHYLEVILLKAVDIFTPEVGLFVHWVPVKMAKKNLLLILVKGTQFPDLFL